MLKRKCHIEERNVLVLSLSWYILLNGIVVLVDDDDKVDSVVLY